MRRTLFGWTAAIVALVAAAIGLAAWSFGDRREWTTDSKPALQAFQAGLEARMRFYNSDAVEHFRRAIELDPTFAAARVELLETTGSSEERERLAEALRALDPGQLRERERYLVELALARVDHAPDRYSDASARFLAARPDDPWALYLAATLAWERQEWPEAEKLYLRLLQVDPNWVMARNHLGYLAMAQGRFSDAEDHFKTYEFVAPDQANPHDSLGELLVLRGRYDEARAELEAGLELRPDFCASYRNLLGIALFESRSADFEPVLERIDAHCSPKEAEKIRCETRLFVAYLDRDYDLPWRENIDLCLPRTGERGLLFHRLALLSGREDVAAAEQEAWRDLAEKSSRYEGKMGGPRSQLLHIEGVRLLAEGDPVQAAERFRQADEYIHFWGLADGRLKLFNLMNLAIALERAGDEAGARKVLDAVREVNPRWAEHYPEIRERTPGRPSKNG
jgi:tetratricopeptide (TPR) repeat protein